MATIINNPSNESGDDGFGLGLILGILFIVVVLGVLFFMYGLPILQGGERSGSQNIEVQVPATTPPVTGSE